MLLTPCPYNWQWQLQLLLHLHLHLQFRSSTSACEYPHLVAFAGAFCISTAAAGRLQQSAATCCDNCICICIRSPAAAYSYANIRNIRTSASSPPLSFCIILRRRSPFFMGTQAKFGNFFACFFFCSEHVRKHLNQLCSNLQRGLQLEGEGVAVCGSNCYVKYEHARRINNASCQRMQNIFLVSRFSRDPGILVSGDPAGMSPAPFDSMRPAGIM